MSYTNFLGLGFEIKWVVGCEAFKCSNINQAILLKINNELKVPHYKLTYGNYVLGSNILVKFNIYINCIEFLYIGMY